MTGNEIRQKFLTFFKSKEHCVIDSDSLVPKDDPTVLFTTAGMQQFKRQFLGHIDGYTRATTSQKCLRTDDLDQVGKTDVHHTFFEMLGNFSFGDYFKKDAISWAWEFLTKELHIPSEKLWVSVYKDDSEAEGIWLNTIGIPKERLVKLGDHSNFWPADAKEKGPNGPCGPCSEIFFDYGKNPKCTRMVCDPDCNCGRFAEIWNLVFTQFNRKDGGELEPLPNKNIDTGMGLERLTTVLQGKRNNFETDLFAPIMAAIDTHIIKKGYAVDLYGKRVIADHLRAIVVAIHDGIIPSNKERGSVIKRLINDSIDTVLQAGAQEPTIYRLVPSVIEALRGGYPQLATKEKDITELIKKTEEACIQVRIQRIPELESMDLAKLSSDQRGALYFKYRDTYGLSIPTISTIALRKGIDEHTLACDLIVYTACMKQQQERSRASSKMMGDVFTDTTLKLDVPKTMFLGYGHAECTATILKMFVDNENANEVRSGDDVMIVLDKTTFYAESGGQVGDKGIIVAPDGEITITDTQKISDIFIHHGKVTEGVIKRNEQVRAQIDIERRLSVMRNHTATHLLQAALRTVLGTHVQQQGSYVAEDRLRFDFTHMKALSPNEIAAVEDIVNRQVLACATVESRSMARDEANEHGALAFFGEKYGDTVRVVSVDTFSRELCGGTHLQSTGQIGLFKITTESAIAQGIRRIEAKTGINALATIAERETHLAALAQIMKAPTSELIERAQQQNARMKQLEKELALVRFAALKPTLDGLIAQATPIGKNYLIVHQFDHADIDTLRKVADVIKQKLPSAVAILGASDGDTAALLITVSDDVVKKGLSAAAIITDVAGIIDGNGGGRPQMAQAGGKAVTKLPTAIKKAEHLAKERLS